MKKLTAKTLLIAFFVVFLAPWSVSALTANNRTYELSTRTIFAGQVFTVFCKDPKAPQLIDDRYKYDYLLEAWEAKCHSDTSCSIHLYDNNGNLEGFYSYTNIQDGITNTKNQIEAINKDPCPDIPYSLGGVLLTVANTELVPDYVTPYDSVSKEKIVFKIPTNVAEKARTTGGVLELKAQRESLGNLNIVPDFVVDSADMPTARAFDQQWYLQNTQMFGAWGLANTSALKTITVAIVDDGVDTNHPELTDFIWENADEIPGNGKDDDNNGYIDDLHGWDFIDQSNEMTPYGSHGTAMAGVIGASAGGNLAGIATGVQIMPLLAIGDENADLEGIVEAIEYAVDNGADVISLSLGTIWTNGYTDKFDAVLKKAYLNDIVVVASAGNGDTGEAKGVNLDVNRVSPVCNDGTQNWVIGVSLTNINGEIPAWANYGKCVDLYAPGVDIPILTTDLYAYRDIGYADGTSLSTPIVVGTVALMKSVKPCITQAEVVAGLKQGGKNLDAYEALKYAQGVQCTVLSPLPVVETPTEEPTPPTGGTVFGDVAATHPNKEAIIYLKDHGVINGYDDGTFKPENAVNRAELLKILIEAKEADFVRADHDKSCFVDAPKGQWFTPYVCYAKEKGWVSGYDGGLFKPAQTVSTVEAMKIILNAYGFTIPEKATASFYADVNLLDWFAPYVQVAHEKSFYRPETSVLSPHVGMTRAGVSQFIYNVLLAE